MKNYLFVLIFSCFQIYTSYSQTIWSQIGSDIEGEDMGDWSGYSTSINIDGDRIAIGAPANDDSSSYSGQVRVYDNIAGNWIQFGNDINGIGFNSSTGMSVSISGDGNILAIGSPYDYGAMGCVRVYEYNLGNWVQIGSDLVGSNTIGWFGYSVELNFNGTVVIAGGPNTNWVSHTNGHVKVYEYSLSDWVQVGTTFDGDNYQDWAGCSVSMAKFYLSQQLYVYLQYDNKY